MSSGGITILGLGPGNPGQLTRDAWEILQTCDELYVRTRQHPVILALPAHINVLSFDHLYEEGDSFEVVYEQIVYQVLELGRREQGVIYAVPGHPFVAEATSPEIVRRAQKVDMPVRIVEGLSFLEPTFTALGVDPLPQLTVMDAMEVAHHHAPLFPPHMPVLIAQIYSSLVASEVKLTLNVLYPDRHPVKLVHAAGTDNEVVEELALYQIDRSPHIGLMTALYVPPLGDGTSFEEFLDVVAHLRAPEGCPWDREQTHMSLRTTLLEETYEVLDALDKEDIAGLQEELGDLLLQIYLHAQIAVDEGEFTMANVVQGIYTKILRRHPHVFARIEVEGVQGVLVNWERIKAEERAAKGKEETSLLDGVTKTLPALTQADQYLKRVARVGFDWPDLQAVLAKLQEELKEVDHALDGDEKLHEVGDLLLAVVNLARWIKVDPESALRQANLRFKKRFRYIESTAKKQGRPIAELSLDEMQSLWQEAKNLH
ncbi:MAG TPA: nucleoside triphosphate pyrophosphohydrolase [Anaerolineales bacterium]|nr:nucleoside triphosphate pyrophosphohydrolase [Anaerolineales bacterium]